MILGEVGYLPLLLNRYYMLGRNEEALLIISGVTLVFRKRYRHEEALCITTRVTLVFKIKYVK